MTSTTENTESKYPLAGLADNGWSKDGEATATCFCGAVQLAFPTEAPGLLNSFVCNCSDCHKITASMFASNFTITESSLKHLRGQENLKTFAQDKTPGSGKTMTNYFCNTCGALMYRIGAAYPGTVFMRIGSVDDFSLHETKLKPTIEQYIKYRVNWLPGLEGVKKFDGMGVF